MRGPSNPSEYCFLSGRAAALGYPILEYTIRYYNNIIYYTKIYYTIL